tara:strand:+ start:7694 stop:8821 length:1128 start_codon:yes stop_codon:yes gene_type:complete
MAAVTATVAAAGIGYKASKDASKAAKRNTDKTIAANKAASDKQYDAQMAGFNLSKPYFKDIYRDARTARDAASSAGPYQGTTYATMDPRTRQGLETQFDDAVNNRNTAMGIADATSGFANNAVDLYGMAGQDNLAGAMEYATGDRYDNLMQAAMRDPYRNLTENTLTGIDASASRAGNMNSSRAGIADAMALRDYQDRSADTGAAIQSDLMNQYIDQKNNQFSNMTTANNNLAGYFGDAMNMQSGATANMIGAGNAFQAENQGVFTDQAQQYENKRMDNINLIGAQGNIMSGAPTQGSVSNLQYQNPGNLYDPKSAGISGALSGGMAAYDMMGRPNLFGGSQPANPITPSMWSNAYANKSTVQPPGVDLNFVGAR